MGNIQISHMVVFERDKRIFVAGRDRTTQHLKLFLIDEHRGDVYARSAAETWVECYGQDRSELVNRVYAAKFSESIPVFRVNGCFNA